MEESSRRPAYLTFFGLTEVPFPTTADPRRLFVSASFAAARDALVTGLAARRGLLCLLGDAGTGKTMLLRQLRETPPPGVRAVMPLHPGLERDEVIELVAGALGVVRESAAPARELETLRAALDAAPETIVLLVDEAQALPAATLAALPELAGLGLQVVLAGQPALEAQLAVAGLTVAETRLSPLAGDEVAAYVRFRLEAAGGTAALLDPAALAAVARVTRGVPRLVNTICEASLVAACAAGVRVVDAEHVKTSWIGHWRFDPSLAPVGRSALDDALAQPAPAARSTTTGPFAPPTRTTVVPGGRRRWPAVLGLTAVAMVAAVAVRVGAWWWAGRPGGSVQVAEAPPAPSPPAAEPRDVSPPRPAELPTPAEALDVIDAFRRAYEARDAARLRPLLAADAVEEGRSGSFEITLAHGRLLERLDAVDYLQPAARLQPRGDAMEVRAPFVIRYRDRRGRSGESRGTAIWQIARRDGAPRIVALTRVLASGSQLP